MKKIHQLMLGTLSCISVNGLNAWMPDSCECWDGSQFGYSVNPPALSPVSDCGTFGVWGEFLWMRAVQDDRYAYQRSNVTGVVDGTTTDATNDFKRVKFDPDWEAGWRVGVGYNLPCDVWGIEADWTSFYNKSSKRSPETVMVIDSGDNTFNGSFISLPNTLAPQISSDAFDSTLTTAIDSSLKLRINQVDAILTREYWVGPALLFKPYVGFRGLFIEESVNSVSNFTDEQQADTIVGLSTQSIKCNSNGYGGKGGFRATFTICDGFSLFGDLSTSILWTHYNTHYTREVVGDGDVTDFEHILRNKESCDVMRLNGDFKGGIQWMCPYDCHQNLFFVRVAWEHHIYLSQNLTKTYLSDTLFDAGGTPPAGTFFNTAGGDLALYGLSVGIGLTF